MTPADLASIIRTSVIRVVQATDGDTSIVPETITVERPRNPEHGDYASNIAMQLAKRLGRVPREFAQDLADELAQLPEISEASVAGPGFLNIRLAADAQGQILAKIVAAGEAWGTGDEYSDLNVNLEFVSANPTGPIHLGGTRWAAVGDALGRMMTARGASVTREYYFNDHGKQIDRFTRSLVAAAQNQPVPEDGYDGAYIHDIAAQILAEEPNALEGTPEEVLETFRAHGTELMFDHIKRTLHEFGTDFDVFFHENSLYDTGAVDRALEELKAKDKFYFADGAWWLRSTDYGDDQDRVVIKSDGDPAYIAGDIAYVKDKFDRGHNLAIYMLGADHHGYIARLRAAAAALGYEPENVEVLIGQMVNLVRDGKAVKMSKRAGTVVTLDDLVEAIGVDAARYSMVRSSVNASLDIDLNLWASQSNENPVYYVQYGHARLSSIARRAAEAGVTSEDADFSVLVEPREGELIRTLGEFPTIVSAAASLREPHRVAHYAERVAGVFHRFYDACQILPKADTQYSEEEKAVFTARLALAEATRQTLANALGLLGVTAPERM